MSVLKTILKDGNLTHHYQRGMLRLLELPVEYGADLKASDNRFFAYLSTLGGGLVGGDTYLQEFKILNTDALICSQSNQKVYKGSSLLTNKITLDKSSKLVFHNDANIFYKDSNFKSKTTIFLNSGARLFYLDGGFIGYCSGEFKANLILRIFVDSKLRLNDNFFYHTKENLSLFYNYEYFYNITIVGKHSIQNINDENIKLFASSIKDITTVRIVSNDNDLAMRHINNLKTNFIKEN
ncbi:MAG: urease accessory protein UreD [Campylobacter sputorum]|uniref:urease accessory protein UreD n=1 Tax=Campylobacter sputorum TaxID=206 RepID=UPI000B76DDCC|nr:urease accessory protein UreD [Campylobacter sputorum]ASM38057.1 urease accessory protein UreD [Campylobacter sputorum bv. paraureolyticus LMG 11764]MDY6121200.1 urease accessory protein UreD [Campylobacter sputorum]